MNIQTVMIFDFLIIIYIGQPKAAK